MPTDWRITSLPNARISHKLCSLSRATSNCWQLEYARFKTQIVAAKPANLWQRPFVCKCQHGHGETQRHTGPVAVAICLGVDCCYSCWWIKVITWPGNSRLRVRIRVTHRYAQRQMTVIKISCSSASSIPASQIARQCMGRLLGRQLCDLGSASSICPLIDAAAVGWSRRIHLMS